MNANWVNRSQSGRWGIYRNTKCGWIAGVCCGIADRLAVKPIFVRGGFVLLGMVGHGIPIILLYIAGVLLLEPRSVAPGFDGAFAAGGFGSGPTGPGYFADRFYHNQGPEDCGPRGQGQDCKPAARGSASGAAGPGGPAPGASLGALGARFAALDVRLNNIEAAVMSDELSLRRKFRDLGG
jgi:phage shock protein PspC (stress-responsive transcriptional regulator)